MTKYSPHTLTCSRPPVIRAFTLMEVLIAIAVFAVGMVAVAAIFPVAIHLQRSTIDDINAVQFEKNAEATVLTQGFSQALIEGYQGGTPPTKYPNTVLPGAKTLCNSGSSPYTWPVSERSYDGGGILTNPASRTFFWVPLFYYDQTNGSGWQVFLFIVKREKNTTYTVPGGLSNPTNSSLSDSANVDTSATGYPNYTNISIPKVVDIAIASNSGPTLTFANSFNNQTQTSNGTQTLKIRPGDKVLTSTGKALSVQSADTSGKTITLNGSATNVVSIWAALPANDGTRTSVDLVGPLSDGSSSTNLVH